MASKGDLSVNLCERYVFGGVFQCDPMQYYGQRAPVSYPVYVSSSTIYGYTIIETVDSISRDGPDTPIHYKSQKKLSTLMNYQDFKHIHS